MCAQVNGNVEEEAECHYVECSSEDSDDESNEELSHDAESLFGSLMSNLQRTYEKRKRSKAPYCKKTQIRNFFWTLFFDITNFLTN